MQFNELVRRRYSVRSCRSTPNPHDVLERVLVASAIAATTADRQSIDLVVVETEGHGQELHRACNAEWFVAQPPADVCSCSIPQGTWRRRHGRNYADVDATIATDHLILAATNEGLGTCWTAASDPVVARGVLGLPEGVEPIAMTPLGRPAGTAPAKLRKSKEQVIRRGRW